jgi:hypothetical protein
MSFTRCLLVVFVLASCPNSAWAQSVTVLHADSSLQRVIARIGSDGPQSVRLVGHGTGRLEADRLRLVADSVFIGTDDGERVVAVIDIDSLWVQQGTAALTLGIVAAVPCALFGASFGSFLATNPDSNGRPGRGPIGALVGALVGGAPCGLLGAGLGSLIRRWRLEYARPTQAAI